MSVLVEHKQAQEVFEGVERVVQIAIAPKPFLAQRMAVFYLYGSEYAKDRGFWRQQLQPPTIRDDADRFAYLAIASFANGPGDPFRFSPGNSLRTWSRASRSMVGSLPLSI